VQGCAVTVEIPSLLAIPKLMSGLGKNVPKLRNKLSKIVKLLIKI
jgi:hypothetical protein